MTQEEAWIQKVREYDRETGGPYVVPPFMQKAEEKENTQDDERPDSGKPDFVASGEETSTHRSIA